MLFLDHKYAGLLSPRLENFTRKRDNLYNFRCPLCGDSKTKKSKMRGYLYAHKGNLLFRCHNCGVSISLGNLIQQLDPELYKQYVMERYQEGEGAGPAHKPHSNPEYKFSKKPEFNKQTTEDKKDRPQKRLLDNLLDPVDTLPPDHEAVWFLEQRQIPKKAWSDLYYIDDVSKMRQLSEKYRENIRGTEPRLVIPFFDREGTMFALTCRALRGESLRYLTIKIKEDAPLVYGCERLDYKGDILICEGPLDSLFLPNCLAVAGSDLNKVRGRFPKDRTTVLPDNQPRNKDVVRYMRGCIDAGLAVTVWPDWIQQKDINDMVVKGGLSPNKIMDIVNTHSYRGLSGRVAIDSWSKC